MDLRKADPHYGLWFRFIHARTMYGCGVTSIFLLYNRSIIFYVRTYVRWKLIICFGHCNMSISMKIVGVLRCGKHWTLDDVP